MPEKLVIPEDLNERFQIMHKVVTKTLDEHKPLFKQLEQYFMGINPQPAWKILDEGKNLLDRLHDAVQSNNVTAEMAAELNTWVNSPKPKVLVGFLETLQKSYHYAHPLYALEGKDLEPVFEQAMPKGGPYE